MSITIPFAVVLESIFVNPVGAEIAFSLFPVTASSAVQGLIVGVVESALAGIDLRLAVEFGASGRIPDGDPPEIGFEPALNRLLLLSPASALAAGRAVLGLLAANLFRAALSTESGGPRVDFGMRAAERCTGVTNAVVGEADGAAVLAETHATA